MVPTTGQMAEILDLIAGHVAGDRTTLVFVNTRSMAERVAHQLGERLGEELGVRSPCITDPFPGPQAAGRGPAARRGPARPGGHGLPGSPGDRRRTGRSPARQIGSPRSFATFLQRVGRSNHTRTGTPACLVELDHPRRASGSAALLRGVRRGRLDAIVVPERPLDILAQHGGRVGRRVVAGRRAVGLARQAMLFRDLSAKDFEDITDLMAEGIRTGRGRRAYHLHRDLVRTHR